MTKSDFKFGLWCIALGCALFASCAKSEPINHKPTYSYTPDHLTPSVVYKEIMRHDIKFADIVLRQAILETGWFTSYNCLNRKNLFGMKGGQKDSTNVNGYAAYDHWTHSVRAYARWQRHHYPPYEGMDYYDFLEVVGYAESSEYVAKLKSIHIIIVRR